MLQRQYHPWIRSGWYVIYFGKLNRSNQLRVLRDVVAKLLPDSDF